MTESYERWLIWDYLFRNILGLTFTATDHTCSFLFFVLSASNQADRSQSHIFFSMWHVLCSCPAIIFTQSSKLLCPRVLSQHYQALSWINDFQYILYSAVALSDLRTWQPSIRPDFPLWLPFMLRWILDIFERVGNYFYFLRPKTDLPFKCHYAQARWSKVKPGTNSL